MKILLNYLWRIFNHFPEIGLKMKLRFFMAFNRFVPSAIRQMSPIRASIHHHTPQEGDVVVDAGAFPGDFSIFASQSVGTSGTVLAFEPHPDNFKVLKMHVEKYDCQNVILIQKGLWDKDTNANIDCEGVEATIGKGSTPVELVALDNELKRMNIDKVNFVKMDIEGAEVRALHGARDTLRISDAKLAIGAYHDFDGKPTREAIESIIKQCGYEFVTEFPERLNTYGWKSSTKTHN